jgi:hypothetical protein
MAGRHDALAALAQALVADMGLTDNGQRAKVDAPDRC